MRSVVKGVQVLGLLALACGGADESLTEGAEQPAQLSENKEAIVRATSNGGRNEAVMLRVLYANGGQGLCSASYFAPRVLLTAAHCLDGAVNSVLAYYGDNLAQDEAQLTQGGRTPPAPGQPSTWAKADSWELNPAWDASLVKADMAVVYLDRKLPFDPMPLFRENLGSAWTNKPAIFSGWGGNTVTSPYDATGYGVQRTGKTVILGTPTAADYHADDPNPGMLDANVRKTVFKTDGHAPNSNACFGDSGGPLFVNKYGQNYIAGVFYWTGLSCADYALWTRIDPYLPFLDNAYKKGGQETLIPRLDCVSPNADGSYSAFFGYNNKNGVAVTVPYGEKNKLAQDTGNTRPLSFTPGDHSFAFGVKFTANQTLTYKLSPDNSPTTTITATKNSPKCSAAQAQQVSCFNSCVAQQKSGCPTPVPLDLCMEDCAGMYGFVNDFNPTCTPAVDAIQACVASTPPGADTNWMCIDESLPFTMSCDQQYADLNTCLGF